MSSSSLSRRLPAGKGRHDARTMPVPCPSRGGVVRSVWPERSTAYGKNGLSRTTDDRRSPTAYRLRVQGQLCAHPLGQPHRVANTAYRADGLHALRKAAELRAQIADVSLDDAGLARGIVPLNVPQDVRHRERAALVQQEQVQDTALRRRELDVHLGADNLLPRR